MEKSVLCPVLRCGVHVVLSSDLACHAQLCCCTGDDMDEEFEMADKQQLALGAKKLLRGKGKAKDTGEHTSGLLGMSQRSICSRLLCSEEVLGNK